MAGDPQGLEVGRSRSRIISYNGIIFVGLFARRCDSAYVVPGCPLAPNSNTKGSPRSPMPNPAGVEKNGGFPSRKPESQLEFTSSTSLSLIFVHWDQRLGTGNPIQRRHSEL